MNSNIKNYLLKIDKLLSQKNLDIEKILPIYLPYLKALNKCDIEIKSENPGFDYWLGKNEAQYLFYYLLKNGCILTKWPLIAKSLAKLSKFIK